MRRIKHEQQNCVFNCVCGAHSLLVVGAAEGVGVGMNREDITRMAQEAGFVGMDGDHGALRRFAALVAKHTLLNLDPNSFMSWQEGFEAGKQTEREACAKLCDDYEEWCGPWGQDDNQYAATESAMEIAKAIRARGQA